LSAHGFQPTDGEDIPSEQPYQGPISRSHFVQLLHPKNSYDFLREESFSQNDNTTSYSDLLKIVERHGLKDLHERYDDTKAGPSKLFIVKLLGFSDAGMVEVLVGPGESGGDDRVLSVYWDQGETISRRQFLSQLQAHPPSSLSKGVVSSVESGGGVAESETHFAFLLEWAHFHGLYFELLEGGGFIEEKAREVATIYSLSGFSDRGSVYVGLNNQGQVVYTFLPPNAVGILEFRRFVRSLQDSPMSVFELAHLAQEQMNLKILYHPRWKALGFRGFLKRNDIVMWVSLEPGPSYAEIQLLSRRPEHFERFLQKAAGQLKYLDLPMLSLSAVRFDLTLRKDSNQLVVDGFEGGETFVVELDRPLPEGLEGVLPLEKTEHLINHRLKGWEIISNRSSGCGEVLRVQE
jgi:hypothetical protein